MIERRIFPETTIQLVKQYIQMLGVVQRQISEEEIFQRLKLALANEGRKVLRDGIAARSSDIGYLKCYGFPQYCGGPMFYADDLGWN